MGGAVSRTGYRASTRRDSRADDSAGGSVSTVLPLDPVAVHGDGMKRLTYGGGA